MDLTTRYLGLELKNPLVASASPLSRTLDGIRRLEDAGIGAVVLYSLFEEQIDRESAPEILRDGSSNGTGTAIGYYPHWNTDVVGPQEYLDLIALAKRSVNIPIIASLNGASPGYWTRYARLMEEAGADALELNLYYLPVDPTLSGAAVEETYLDTVRAVKESTLLPVAVKLVPFFTSLPHFAHRLVSVGGANALVLFNRFYQPDLDLETGEAIPRLTYSTSNDLRLPLHLLAILRRAQIKADLALTSGVHTSSDALKGLMAGADVVMLASELLENGVGRVSEILAEMVRWLDAQGYPSVSALRVTSQGILSEPAAWERAGYVHTLRSADPHAGKPFV